MGAGASNTGYNVSPYGIGAFAPQQTGPTMGAQIAAPTNTMGTPSTGSYAPPSMTAPTSLAPMQAMPQLPAQMLPAMDPQMVGQLLQSRVAPRYSELMAQMAARGMPSAYRESAVYNGMPGEGLRTGRIGDGRDARGIKGGKGGQGATSTQTVSPANSLLAMLAARSNTSGQ